jgi:hypothetical protein
VEEGDRRREGTPAERSRARASSRSARLTARARGDQEWADAVGRDSGGKKLVGLDRLGVRCVHGCRIPFYT